MAAAATQLERLWTEGRWNDLLELTIADLSAARSEQDPRKQAQALNLLASVHGAKGNWAESLRAARAALRIHRQIGDALGIARSMAGLSAAYAAERGPKQALRLFQITCKSLSGVDEVVERCHAAGTLGMILIGLERTREARDVLDEAIGLCQDDELAWCGWMLLEIKSRACRADQDLDSAIQCLEEGFLLRQREGAISAACLRTIADLYLEAGRTWEATEMYRMAISHAREQGAVSEAQRTETRMHEVAHPQDLQRGRLTYPGLKTPSTERSH